MSTCFHLPCSHYYIFTFSLPSIVPLIFSLMFAIPALALMSSYLIFSILFIAIIYLNILISVLSSKFCSAFLCAQVSLPYLRTGLIGVLVIEIF